MRLLFRFSIFIFFLASCETDEVRPDTLQDEPELTPFNSADHDEFILVDIEGRRIIFTANTKSSQEDEMGVKVSTRYRASGHRYFTFSFWGAKENEEGKEVLRFGGELGNYLGEGFYAAGKGMENNCYLFDFGRLWKSHYDANAESYLELSEPSQGYIEGKFVMKLHNPNHHSDFKKAEGRFRLAMD